MKVFAPSEGSATSVEEAGRRKTMVLRHPVTLIALVAVAALIGGVVFIGSGRTAPKVTATLSEWKVDLGRATFGPGKYSFVIKDAGRARHELIAFKTDATGAVPRFANGNVNEDASSIVKVTDGDDIAPGRTQTRTVELRDPGTYVFMCNLPGHYTQGMHTTVTVR